MSLILAKTKSDTSEMYTREGCISQTGKVGQSHSKPNKQKCPSKAPSSENHCSAMLPINFRNYE